MKTLAKTFTAIALLVCICSFAFACGTQSLTINGNDPQENVNNEQATENTYTIYYMVDGSCYKRVVYQEGDTIASIEEPEKDGYTFTGWSQELPAVMPANDITVTAQYTANTYTISYYVDDVFESSANYACGEAITPIVMASEKDGKSFSGFLALPKTMPSADLSVYGYYYESTLIDLSVINGSYTVSTGGIYTVKGENSNAQLIINAAGQDVTLLLSDATLAYEGNEAAIKCVQANSLTFTLLDNAVFSVSDTSNNTSSGAIEVKKCDSLIINGTGSLVIDAKTAVPDSENAGLYTSKSLTIENGTINVTSLGQGLTSKQNMVIKGGAITIESTDDGLKSKSADIEITGGVITIESEDDAINAETAVSITAGSLYLTSADEGISVKNTITISGGDIEINSMGDGVKAENDEDATVGEITISGGNIKITSATDGIQSAVSLTITGTPYIEILAGGGYLGSISYDEDGEEVSKKGMKSTDIVITSGTIVIDSFEDCIHANGSLSVVDGCVTLHSARDGMSAETNLEITDGDFTIMTSTGFTARDSEDLSLKGIKAESKLLVKAGKFDINTRDDAIHSNADITIEGGAFVIKTGDDGFHADATLTVSGGTIDIQSSYEGLEGYTIHISGGNIHVVASDDGINAAGGTDSSSNSFFGSTSSNALINITGGYIYVNASGDGIDSNKAITMSGGTVIVMGPTNSGNGALDYDGTFSLTGGFLLAMGPSAMAQAPTASSSTQRILAVTFSGSVAANTVIGISGDDCDIVFSSPKAFSNFVISSPDFTANASLTISYGADVSGGVFEDFIYSGTATGGTTLSAVTLSSMVTTIGTVGTGGTPGGGSIGGGGGMTPPGRR